MKILLQSFANIRDVLGARELEIELQQPSSLAGLLAELSRRFGAAFNRQIRDQLTGEIVPFLILVNGTAFRTTVDLAAPLKDGDTVAIAGVIQESRTMSSSGIPVLHRIPILGGLFGARSYSTGRTELIVLMTPRVIYDTNQIRDATEELRSKVKGLAKEIKD